VRDHEVFINDNLDLDAHYAASMRVGPPMELAATCYNSVWPEISEPGTSIIVLTALVHGAPWRKVPPADYMGAKRAIAETMIGMAERVFPGLRESAEVVSVSTPLTNMRYTGNLDGSIYGFVQTPQNHTILRMPPKGPIAGLYFAGAWTRPGGGFSPAMLSGQMTVEEILMRKELN
jgi:prolycopene isomerase